MSENNQEVYSNLFNVKSSDDLGLCPDVVISLHSFCEPMWQDFSKAS